MTSTSTVIGDRRRAAQARLAATRRHPSRRRPPAAVTETPTIFYWMTGVVLGFVLLGLVMVMSASSISEFNRHNSPWRLFNRQLMWAGAGLLAMWIAMRIPLHRVRRWLLPGLIAVGLSMFAPFVPGLGASINGARAWISIGGNTFQPSEVLKFMVLLYTAHLLSNREQEMHDLRRTLYPVLFIAGSGAVLCLVQSDLGSAIVLASAVLVMVFLAGTPITPFIGVSTTGSALAVLYALSTPYRRDRFTAFLDIEAHRSYLSYQTYQAQIALANGGWTGQGVGRGTSKLGDYLPLAHSDFIFAVIGEELGFLGAFVVVGGFLLFAYCGMQVALAADDRFSKLLAGGLVSWFVVQAVINIGGVIGLMPVTGLTLPFFSYGGSSLLVTLVASGVLLNVARHTRRAPR